MNVKPVEAKYDDTVADRFQDPGAGAFSYHGGQIFHATRDITAGEEMFAGELVMCWVQLGVDVVLLLL